MNNDAQYNTAVGKDAVRTNTSGSRLVGVGNRALYSNTTGNYNHAFGDHALFDCTTGDANVAVGFEAGANLTTGDYNVAVGHQAMSNASVSGNNNCAVGRNSLYACTTGNHNTAVGGSAALYGVTTGTYNTAIGVDAGIILTTGSNNTLLGYGAGGSSSPDGGITTGSNIIILGNNSVSNLKCNVSLSVTSDERDKADITDFTKGLDIVNSLRPVTYKRDNRTNYSDDYSVTPDGSKKSDTLEIGLIAQEVETVEKANGYSTNGNDRLFINKQKMGTIIV